VVIWTTVEPGVYLIAACLPSLRPLLKYLNIPLESARSRLQHRSSKSSPKNTSEKIALVPRFNDISASPRVGFPRPDDPSSPTGYEGEIDQRRLVAWYISTTCQDEEAASSQGRYIASGSNVNQKIGEHAHGIKCKRTFSIYSTSLGT
jgi:hypothetical protein